MAKQQYFVPVFYTGMAMFWVEVDEGEDPTEKAIQDYKDGKPSTPLGNEFEEVSKVGEPERITTGP